MKTKIWIVSIVLTLSLLLGSCSVLFGDGSDSLESTRVALAIQQTSLAMGQAEAARQVEPPAEVQEVPVQPTYTLYPTYTVQVVEPPAEEPEVTEEPEVIEESIPAVSFEEWMKDVNILLYDDLYGRAYSPVIENAIDALRLSSNTKNVGDAMGDFLSEMNSSTTWDLIIIGAESRDNISGEYFDVLIDQMDRGSSIIIEVWYLDDVFFGRVQPIFQRCGITFHKDWQRGWNSNLNDYLVYLLKPDDPMFSNPNPIKMLVPYDTEWFQDIGDTLELISGTDAVLLAGRMPKEHSAYGLVAECLDGRMIWQTFSTHDYKDQEMTSLWMNYIYNALQARYEYLQ